MWSELRASWALLFGVGFIMLGNGLQGTLLGLRATLEGFPTFATGIVMSGYFVGIFLGSVLAPRLVQRVGHIRVFAALASLASISVLVHGIHVSAVSWTMMRLVTGLSYAGLFVVAESWLNDRASNETRGQVLSVYMVITTLGLGGGQFLLNLGNPLQVELFVLVSIIVSIGLIPILLTARPAPAFGASSSMSLRDLYRASPLAVFSNCLTGMAHGTIFGLGSVYAVQSLERVELVSLFMACFLLGSLVTQWPVGWLADRINRRIILAGLCVTAVIGSLTPLFLDKGSVLYFASIVLLGGAAMPMYSLSVAYANDRLEPEQIVAASGSLLMVGGIGLSTGPLVVSFLMGQFGISYFFFGVGGFFGLILCFTIYRMCISEAVLPEEQGPNISAGVIGTPVAEYNSPQADEYVEARIRYDLDRLDRDREPPAQPDEKEKSQH
ncbi:MAG: MFS transporter [Gammaproteobacteria bacterium]|nr:MFS transporter [Gammaproteobacteria bacterium]